MSGERLRDAINRSWSRLLGAWEVFRDGRAKLPSDDRGTTLTRERWLLPLFQELGYGRLVRAPALEIEGRSFSLSHLWGRTPVHLLGCNVTIDRRQKGVPGAAGAAPHGLVQHFLNLSDEHLWGFVSNGLVLRLLRDNNTLTRQAYVEFDLEAMFEENRYSEFAVLWLVCHQSRVEGEKPEECWLEKWSKLAQEEGGRALDRLRVGVEQAITRLGGGFLRHRANRELQEALRAGTLDTQDYYRQLLRLVYRLIFLLVAEAREALLDPAAPEPAKRRYREHYSLDRLRTLAGRRRGGPHGDRWRALSLVMGRLHEGCPELGLPALWSFLWSPEALPDLERAELANEDLLEALRELASVQERGVRRSVNWRDMGSEELGSVYEALLELHPRVHRESGAFDLGMVAGSERKLSGSYYTPDSLVQCLLDSALEPVLDAAVAGRDKVAAERALLDLKVCDPACGSGHFLVAAARRIARRLASLRSGDEEPSPPDLQRALREVVGRCLYGIDLNPMALELCKVSLWMEAVEPGRPLSFLDSHVQVGNSLLGVTPTLLAGGIPKEAFTPIAGDDPTFAKNLVQVRRYRDEQEARSQIRVPFADDRKPVAVQLAERMARLDAMREESLADVRAKETAFRKFARSEEYQTTWRTADAWCAAFVWPKWRGAPDPVTDLVLRHLREQPSSVASATRSEIDRVASQYAFFHWHLAFPQVFTDGAEAANGPGWAGGFDAVLSNPPWERIKLQEQEFFAERHAAIADAPTKVARTRLIDALEKSADLTDRELHAEYVQAVRLAEGESLFLRKSGRYPLCGRGDINTYAVFSELMRSLVSPPGRLGCVVPSGVATDDTTKFFFQDLVDSGALVTLYDFENRKGLFPAVDSRMKFCLLTVGGRATKKAAGAEFVFFAHDVVDLEDPERRVVLTAQDIARINPNTRTCPIFRTQRDAEITKGIYERVPVLLREGVPDGNPWGVEFATLFHMSNDSSLFQVKEDLEKGGWRLEGSRFQKGDATCWPLYEAKMIHHFNHRFGDYRDLPRGSKSTQLPNVPLERLEDPNYEPLPRYWVPEKEVRERLAGKWDRGWLLGWRDITNATNERTVIASVIPRVGVGNQTPLMLLGREAAVLAGCLVANLAAFVYDFASRQKVGGTHINFFIYEQLPVLPPRAYEQSCPWGEGTVADWLTPRVLELLYTSAALASFARDAGYEEPPFRWDAERRFALRCELDAAFFHLYGIAGDDVVYILDTFPIVKEKDEKRYGEYRTRIVILEAFDRLAALSSRGAQRTAPAAQA
ncbi:MAG: N-6 DNA methylase [bacterium]